jgi:hypothetical protein
MIVSRRDEENNWDNQYVYVRTIKIRSYPLDYDNNVAKLWWDKTRITEAPVDFSTDVTDAAPELEDEILSLFNK